MDSGRGSNTLENSPLTKISVVQTTLSNGVPVRDERGFSNEEQARKNSSGCFGFVNGKLYIGDTHHALILYNGIERGEFDWESLMNAKQKWGWFQTDYNNGDLIVRFTTDEAQQTEDSEYSALCRDSLGLYFNKEAKYDAYVGETGMSSVDPEDYGNRAKQQYYNESPDDERYCEHCDTYYDPDWETHDHNMVECPYCGDDYDANDYGQESEHEPRDVTPDEYQYYADKAFAYINKPSLIKHYNTKQLLGMARTYLEGKHIQSNDIEEIMKHMSQVPGQQSLWEPGARPQPTVSPMLVSMTKQFIMNRLQGHPTYVDAVKSSPALLPAYFPDLYNQALEFVQQAGGNIQGPEQAKAILGTILKSKLAKVGSDWQEIKTSAIIREVDIGDREVFIKLTAENYPNQSWYHSETDQWYSPEDYPGYDPLSQTVQGTPIYKLDEGGSYYPENTPTDPAPDDQTFTPQHEDPSADPAERFADNPALLAIESNPKSTEYRWSYDGTHLHIWRVLNRWQYGPSHYDMFGREGYEAHSQGRVYVSPDGKVGVLYWQISHPECEDALHQWVEKEFHKEPDLVYRAYGPYAGEQRSRWMFPIVEVSGLPIHPRDRWWERGQRSPWDNYNSIYEGVQQTSYPEKKKKNIKVKDLTNPETGLDEAPFAIKPKRNRKRKRRPSKMRQRQYRNRSRR
jgi:hypothetical protein